MLLGGIVLWLELRRSAERCEAIRRDGPLMDPLERAEWRGLGFVLPLLAWFSGGGKRRRT
ncbi:hypothetical protein [Rhizobium sp. SL86]|uniref:hypothetical protein n=1 Tax=Rhizobium sp. SL86 TaxID=2995148 RepID=UPI0022733517|nr:hypothetical protein [Rhizobium sp. SL86]MCY1667914.1 hypothetical protein [Rhizobium sp. SL86]